MPCSDGNIPPCLKSINARFCARQIVRIHRDLTGGDDLLDWNIRKVANEARCIGLQEYSEPFTAILCDMCRSMSPEQQDKYIWDGRCREARKLADWWEDHMEEDRRAGRGSDG